MTLDIRDILDRLREGDSFSAEECQAMMDAFVDGSYQAHQTAAILTAFFVRGEQAEELAGFVTALRKRAVPFSLEPGTRAADNCGTGGDGSGSINLSSAAALLAGAAGVPIVKHGNRSISSRSGSADFLEALGLRIDLPPDKTRCLFKETGFAFLFAPMYHPAVRQVQPIRKALGIRTLFNLAGPLANPAPVTTKLIGVARPGELVLFNQTMARLGYRRTLTIWGEPGLDEVSPCGTTRILYRNGDLELEDEFHPSLAGYGTCTLNDIQGGTGLDNAMIFRSILDGKRGGPVRDAVVFNTAALLWVSGRASDMYDGCTQAEEVLDSGLARDYCQQLIQAGNRMAGEG